ncbi:MAG: hypothetical protein HQL54_00965 [Magnetococcales bacterium]|nr:hypothetical protein [Magnetococcales bacterium]
MSLLKKLFDTPEERARRGQVHKLGPGVTEPHPQFRSFSEQSNPKKNKVQQTNQKKNTAK